MSATPEHATHKKLFGRSVSPCHENFPGSELTAEEVAFAIAMHRYMKTRRRPFPAWSEVLGVLKSLGYRKCPDPEPPPPGRAD